MISTKSARTKVFATLAAGAAAAGATLLAPVAAQAAPTATTAPAAVAAASDTLKPGMKLKAGQYILSKNKQFKFIMQGDGNAVLYKGKTALWSTATNRKASVLVMQKNGDLQVVSGKTAVWRSNTGTSANARLVVQNDNNLVIYNTRNKPNWSRYMVVGTLGANRVLKHPEYMTSVNRTYRVYMQGDGNLVLVKGKTPLWSTKTQSKGAFAAMQADGNLVVYSAAKKALWSSKTNRKGSVLVLQNSGDLQIINGRSVVWRTNTAGR
ncbi:hypothetical protein HPO96_33200 [Kribbella sandramycini]|uniref:Ribosomal protein L30E n=1 Tax=Kribbella sandramycini TaxID=60450 RepID=A0A7Y4L846_9ACTN|nr:hypothetical protein [Kribbella sandramycini]MBB6566117.1 ribosomal protein L30E [Kribbella sandramycini]NOL45117.1 hypothetical protein [Kribbella sandramycini]